MPSEDERNRSAFDHLAERPAAQVADDQRVLGEARDELREITDAERDQLREAKAAAPAPMPAESNAPATLWVPIRRSDGRTGRARTDRDDAMVFAAVDIVDSPTAWTAEQYVRADLVVPTVDEIAAGLRARGWVESYDELALMARDVRALLVERVASRGGGDR